MANSVSYENVAVPEGLAQRMDRRFYPGQHRYSYDELFRQEILRYLRSDDVVLDLGAGAGIISQMNFRFRAAHVCGVDLDERVLENPYLDEARIGNAEASGS